MIINKKIIKVIQTVRDSEDRLTHKDDMAFENNSSGTENLLINIYEDVVYQEIEGFGGAFTEAGSVTIDKMSSDKRNEILNAYLILSLD